ncbi:MAG TPA: hypothetical protein VK249_34240, partial [Anaerolineales bacterium]|nr:hypothetical protein [Anaerolineales bacterium]
AEVHGPYCNIFRQVLQLVPGDVACACFKDTSQAQASEHGMAIGHFEGVMNLDYEEIRALGARFARPKACENCFLGYHCTYNCPNACLLRGELETTILCQLLKRVFGRRLLELAGELSRIPGPIAGTVVSSV